MSYQISSAQATQLAEIALHSIDLEFPYSAQHVHRSAEDTRLPRELHPAFFGCFDWHSAVHSHWMLMRILRTQPDLPIAPQIRSALNTHLSEANLRTEADYFLEPGRRSYERPYGWAWLLKLTEEAYTWDDPDAQRWYRALLPLAEIIVENYLQYLPKLTYPVRSGMHNSTAFGMLFAYDYARTTGQTALLSLIEQRSHDYFGADSDYPGAWEPSGSDFLSAALITADLMRRVYDSARFATWLDAYLPRLAEGEPARLLTPAFVSDRSDGQIVHLDGLNLSRAWCWWGIAQSLPVTDPRRAIVLRSAEAHASAGLSGIGTGEYMGEHWLGSFALYMLEHIVSAE